MKLQIQATLLRSTGPKQPREPIWTRHYAWMDTAMPRIVQLVMRDSQPSDVVEFIGKEQGFQIGVLFVNKGNQLSMEWSPLVKTSPGLMKLLGAC